MAIEKPEMVIAKPVMVIGIDDSEHSYYALQWTLQHFFPKSHETSTFQLVIVNSIPLPSTGFGLAGTGAVVMPYKDADLTKNAVMVVEKAKELCTSNSVNDVIVEIVEGDARNVMCDVVEKHQAEVLVVGSHGYGAIKRAVLGSVSDYCAHHANCSVLIVKKPKQKN